MFVCLYVYSMCYLESTIKVLCWKYSHLCKQNVLVTPVVTKIFVVIIVLNLEVLSREVRLCIGSESKLLPLFKQLV